MGKVYYIKSYISTNNLLSSATAAPRACLGKLKLKFQEIISMKVAYEKIGIDFVT